MDVNNSEVYEMLVEQDIQSQYRRREIDIKAAYEFHEEKKCDLVRVAQGD